MTEASGLADDQAHRWERLARATQCRENLSSPRLDQPSQAPAHLSDQLRKMVEEAPLQSVFAAFLLGVLRAGVARSGSWTTAFAAIQMSCRES